MATRQFATFHIDDRLLGLEVWHVQEVLRPQPLTPVPLADPSIAGLINLRGQVVTALDLRARMGLTSVADIKTCTNVVVRGEGEVTSLLVDSIGDVIDIDDSAFEAPPETLNGAGRDLIRGAYKLPNGLMLALDVDAALSRSAAA
jgi:purine-binding chemotaxis protein CheW